MSRVIPDFAIVHAGEALFQEFLVLIVDPRVFRNELSVFFSRPDGSVIERVAYTGVPVTIIAVSIRPTPFSFPTLVEESFARRVFFLERPRPVAAAEGNIPVLVLATAAMLSPANIAFEARAFAWISRASVVPPVVPSDVGAVGRRGPVGRWRGPVGRWRGRLLRLSAVAAKVRHRRGRGEE